MRADLATLDGRGDQGVGGGRGHGRVETRRVRLTAVGAGIGFPHARLAIQVQRRRRAIGSRSWTGETVYAITSMNWRQARADLVADAIRGHWRIENELHWVKDVVLGEDACRVRTEGGPQLLAGLRNAALRLLRRSGIRQIAAGLRHLAAFPEKAIQLVKRSTANDL